MWIFYLSPVPFFDISSIQEVTFAAFVSFTLLVFTKRRLSLLEPLENIALGKFRN